MKTSEIKKQIVEIYKEKGLNAVHFFLKRNKIAYKQEVIEFGLNTNNSAKSAKHEWLNSSELKFHYYNRGVKSRKTGYSYNIIRGTQIIIL